MSYNIDNVTVIEASEDFGITPQALRAARVAADRVDGIPEGNIFDQHEHSGGLNLRVGSSLWWHGEGSGRAFDALVDRVLPRFSGHADFVVCFEGGDSYVGLRLMDGKVTKHEVKFKLGEVTR